MEKERMVIVNFKVTEREQKMIERHAKKAGMTVSEYARTTLYLDMVLAGDMEAIRFVLGKLRGRMAEKVKTLGLARAEE